MHLLSPPSFEERALDLPRNEGKGGKTRLTNLSFIDSGLPN